MIGPASDSSDCIAQLIDAGVNVFRLGLAHDDIDVVLALVGLIREIAKQKESSAAVLIDLPGPKVRAGSFGKDGVALDDASVVCGGIMRGRPGVHIPSDRLSVTTPTADDIRALDAAVAAGVEMVAVSFVRCARDVRALGLEWAPAGLWGPD